MTTDFELALGDVAFWTGLLIFQLPVGIVADRWRRKGSIVTWEALRCFGILGYGLGTRLLDYVLANILWSLGAAFSIGTSAFLYETLLEVGREVEFPKYMGRNTTIQLAANACGAFLGGLLVSATGSIQVPLLVGAAWNLSAVAVALTFEEPKVTRAPEPRWSGQIRRGLRIVRHREGIALLIGLEVFLGVSLYGMALFRPVYLQVIGLSEIEIATWISGFLLIAALVSAFAGDLSFLLGEFGILATLVALASGSFLGMWVLGANRHAVLLQAPIYVAWSLQPPMVTAFMNRRLEPGERATVLSMGAFAYTLGVVVVEPLAGFVTTEADILTLGLYLGLLSLLPGIYILVRWRFAVAPWPPVTPIPTGLVPGGRISRFSRLLERLSRLRP